MGVASLGAGLDVLNRRAQLANLFIILFIGGTALTLACQLAEMGGLFDINVESSLQLVAALIYVSGALLYLASVVFVAMWIHRAHANLFTARLEGLEFTPGWSVGWFFVPIANLFKPFHAMRELWNASHDASDSYGQPAPSELVVWWGTFIASNMLSNLGARMEQIVEAQPIGLFVGAVGTAVSIACAVFLMRIIQQITNAQRSMMAIRETFA